MLEVLKIYNSVTSRVSYAGCAPKNVKKAVKEAKKRFLKDWKYMINKIIILISMLAISMSISNCGKKAEPLKPSQIIKTN